MPVEIRNSMAMNGSNIETTLLLIN